MTATFTRATPARERLTARLVLQPNGCWHWTGVVDKSGYGRVGYKGRSSETIQRAVYDCFVGPIPDGHTIDHLCHTRDLTCTRLGPLCMHRRCGNPEHLEAVLQIVNTERSGNRLSECVNGHKYTEDNTYRRPHDGRRLCVTCYIARYGRPPVRRSA